MDSCEKLEDLLKMEKEVIMSNVKEEDYMSFIHKYGDVMRQVYCGYACSSRYDCDLAKKYLKNG